MHDLIKASKKHVALTGTIAGGYASDLFYTLYRLDPARMKSKGYSYGSKGERHFVEQYGTVETVYEVIENTQYHASSRGRVITPLAGVCREFLFSYLRSFYWIQLCS